MPISATCPECRTTFRAADTARGKKVRCSRCKTIFLVGADEDNDSSALTTAPAMAKSARKTRAAVEDDYEDRLPVEKVQKSILPYVLIGLGVLVLLCGGGGTLAGIYIWKESIRIEREKEEEARKRAEERREEAEKRFREVDERIRANIEKAKADHEQRRQERQKRNAEDQKRSEEERKQEEKESRERQQFFEEQRKRIEADIQAHRKKAQDRFQKNAPPNFADPFAPQRPQQMVQKISRSIPLQGKLQDVHGVLWTGAGGKQAVVVRVAGLVVRLDRYDLTSGRKLDSMDTTFDYLTSSIRDISSDGKYYVCNRTLTEYTIWAFPNPTPLVARWQAPPLGRAGPRSFGKNAAAAYLLNGPRLLTVNDAGQVALWSIPKASGEKPTLQKSYLPPETVARYSEALVGKQVVLSPDRTRLAVFNGSDGFFLLDTATLQLQGAVTSPEDALPADKAGFTLIGAAFNPNGNQFAAIFHAKLFVGPDEPQGHPQFLRWDIKSKKRTARFADPSELSMGPNCRVGWWGNDFLWVDSFVHRLRLFSWTKERPVLRVSRWSEEKIYFGNPDGKCWFVAAGPDGNAILKSVELPAAALEKADEPLSLTANGIVQ